MKTTLFFGTSAYVMIRDPERNIYQDIKLEPGRSAQRSLREYAADLQYKAARLLRNADIAIEAATQLEREE